MKHLTANNLLTILEHDNNCKFWATPGQVSDLNAALSACHEQGLSDTPYIAEMLAAGEESEREDVMKVFGVHGAKIDEILEEIFNNQILPHN